MSEKPRRNYSDAEVEALRRAFRGADDPTKRGPAQHACGPYYPAMLRERADDYEKLIPKLRLAADALEREIANDPRCQPGVPQ